MKHHNLICCLLAAALVPAATYGQEKNGQSAENEEEKALKTAIKAYADTFNARDAKKLASYWSPDGVYTSRSSGDEIVGRKNLETEFAAIFKENKDSRLALETESIEFVSPNVALEKGLATILRPKADPEKTTYNAVYIKMGGLWLIDRVSERAVPVIKSHYEQLKELEWMIGDWVDKDKAGGVIKTSCKWTRNRNFITRTFTASIEDRVQITGMQFVGWDPARKEIRSWVFDSDGGFAEGTWKKLSGNWIVKTNATLPDGTRGASTTILRQIDSDTFGWQKTGRTVDGQILPNLDEVAIIREGT